MLPPAPVDTVLAFVYFLLLPSPFINIRSSIPADRTYCWVVKTLHASAPEVFCRFSFVKLRISALLPTQASVRLSYVIEASLSAVSRASSASQTLCRDMLWLCSPHRFVKTWFRINPALISLPSSNGFHLRCAGSPLFRASSRSPSGDQLRVPSLPVRPPISVQPPPGSS